MKQAISQFAALMLLAAIAISPMSAQAGRRLTIVNPNTATEAELQKVANLTPALVTGLIAKRPFLSQADLNSYLAATLKPKQLVETYKGLFLRLNLNTATRQEILMIPGVGKRMAHEFEEYRPWKSIEQFRREIGKYVKPPEVARLERYVTIRETIR